MRAAVLFALACAPAGAAPLANGVYAVLREAPTEAEARAGGAAVLRYDAKYSEADRNLPPRFVALDTASFVPLVIAGPPRTTRDARGWTMLGVTLAAEHVRTLEEFTRRHLDGTVAVVIGGEIVTIHKVRSAITGGEVQITRCFDDACQVLRAKLAPDEWRPLFDGRSLAGWKEAEFTRRGRVTVENGAIVFGPGEPMTGIAWTGEFPRSGYEVRFEGARLEGGDFFASLTFPVGGSHCTWVLGGWGGDIVGLSSLEGWDASDNDTRSYFTFENGRWYALRLRVTDERVTAWIDGKVVVDVKIAGRVVELRDGEIEVCTPLGFASYATRGAVRKIEYRALPR